MIEGLVVGVDGKGAISWNNGGIALSKKTGPQDNHGSEYCPKNVLVVQPIC